MKQAQGLLARHAGWQWPARRSRDIAAADKGGDFQTSQGMIHVDLPALGLRLVSYSRVSECDCADFVIMVTYHFQHLLEPRLASSRIKNRLSRNLPVLTVELLFFQQSGRMPGHGRGGIAYRNRIAKNPADAVFKKWIMGAS